MAKKTGPTLNSPYNVNTLLEIKKPGYNKVSRKNNNTTYDAATPARKDDKPYNKKPIKSINSA